MELGIGIALAAVMVFVAVFFMWRQQYTLGQLRLDSQLAPEDRLYYVKQIRRRMLCSVLLIVFAGLLAGSFAIDDPNLREPAQGEVMPDDVKDHVRLMTYYWSGALFLLLAILLLASFDLVATARFGMRRVRQLENDRRAVLEMEAAKLRRRRQEMN